MKRNSIISVIAIIGIAIVLISSQKGSKNGNIFSNLTNKFYNIPNSDPSNITNEVLSIKEQKLPAIPKVFKAKGSGAGTIGTMDGASVDNPSDNVFHIQIDRDFTGNSQAYLEYELYGVRDFNSICKGINDQVSFGGMFVKIANVWSNQTEMISTNTLRKGDNIIRFSVPANCEFGYKVRNVKIRFEENESLERKLVVNTPSTHYYFKKYGYLNGFVTGKGSDKVKFYANGKQIRSFRSAFEGRIEKDNDTLDTWNAVITAVFEDGQQLSTNVYFDKASLWDYSNEYNPEIPYSEIQASKFTEINLQQAGFKLQGEKETILENKKISVTGLRSEDMALMNSGMINVTGVNNGFRCLPHNSRFEKNLKIHIQYDTTKIPRGYSPKDIRTFYFDENTNRWVMLPIDTLDIENHEVISYTNHFTDFVNGILKTPEAPQTSAFTPTSMKDIKFADPLAGFNVIAPPSANNSGTANLSYPIEIPSGRQGMQPQLSISYSSDGGNGWLGVGWDLSTPSVTVDTRWGVPRYYSNFESESYLLNGEELLPQINKEVFEIRSTDTIKIFKPKVEGAFNKIIRHGNSTSTYWWEVIDKQGVKYYYGKYSSGNKIDPNSVLRSPTGNIAKWVLTEIKDLNKNFIKYKYDVDTCTTGTGIGGINLTLKEITYTGYNDVEGKYRVEFLSESLHTNIDARFGFKVSSTQNLTRINVYYQTTPIRTYLLNYKLAAFIKPLICSIIEINDLSKITYAQELTCVRLQENNLFNQNGYKVHRFEYFDESDYGFSANDTIFNTDDEDGWSLIDNLNLTKESTLGRTRSGGFSVGGELALGFGKNLNRKTNSFGGNYTYTGDWSRTLSNFIDINGDGLQDKVVRKSSGLYYRQLQYLNNELVFDNDLIKISGLDIMGNSVSHSNNIGLRGSIGFIDSSALNIAVAKNTNYAYVPDYFADVNGDGLVDFIKDGKTYFNNTVNPDVVNFINTNDDTIYAPGNSCNYIIYTGELNEDLLESTENNDDYGHDGVRMWVAPFSGRIAINPPIKLIQDTSYYRKQSRLADGISFTIQHNTSQMLYDTINPSNYSNKLDTILYRDIVKGDRIYFRLQSRYDRSWDNVQWNPLIWYVDQANPIDTSICDADGKKIYRFKPSDDLLFNNKQVFMAPYGGNLNIKGTITSQALSDTLRFLIVKGANNIIKTDTFFDNSTINYSIDYNLNVSTDDTIRLFLKGNSNINFNNIKYDILIDYNYTNASDSATIDPTSEYSRIKFRPMMNFSIYQNCIKKSKPYTLSSGNYTLNPSLQFKAGQSTSGNLCLVVKTDHKVIAKKFLTLQNNTFIGNTTLSFNLNSQTKVYFEYFSDSTNWTNKFDGARVIINSITDSAAFHIPIEDTLWKFGNLYHGWGQFAYKNPTPSDPINENKLYLQVSTNIQNVDTHKLATYNTYDGLTIAFDSLGIGSPISNEFNMMYPDLDSMYWKEYSGIVRIKSNDMLNSLPSISGEEMGTYDSPFGYKVLPNDKILAPRKYNKQVTYSGSISYGATKWNIGGSYTQGKNESLMEYFDINGDRFPDVISKTASQITNPQGGLPKNYYTHQKMDGTEEINQTVSNIYSEGATAGTRFPILKLSPASDNNPEYFYPVCNASVSGSIGHSNNNTQFSFADINGDGLPDKVTKEGKVALNIGYSFLDFINWNFDDIQSGYSNNAQVTGGVSSLTKLVFDKCEKSWSGGISLSSAWSKQTLISLDMNADGLNDNLKIESGTLKVQFNTGNGFIAWSDFSTSTEIFQSRNITASGDVAFTFGIPFNLLGLQFKFLINPQAGGFIGWNLEKSTLLDINNDGYPDLVEANGDNIIVKYSTLGKINLLKTVTNPTGSKYSIDYSLSTCNISMPQRNWVMSSLIIYDGHNGDGKDYMYTKFEYQNGIYDRYERQSYGFEKVITKQYNTFGTGSTCYRSTIEHFHNTDFFFKGLKNYEVILDGSSNKYIETFYTYKKKEIETGNEVTSNSCHDPFYPAIAQEDRYYYEGLSTAQIHTKKTFTHGEYGNIKIYYDYGDVSDNNDDIKSIINYTYDTIQNLLSMVLNVEIKDINNIRYRYRTATYSSKGQVTQINAINGTTNSTVDLVYDSYGNLLSITMPENANGERNTVEYIYESTLHTYPEYVTDNFGQYTHTVYEYLHGLPTSVTDISGNQMLYTYYLDGKLNTITAPKEIASSANYTMKFEYWDEFIHNSGCEDTVIWAKTHQVDPINSGNEFINISFVDGLGRNIQSKQKATILGVDSMIVSGKANYDEYGRVLNVRLPITEAISNDNILFNYNYDPLDSARITYDMLDRPLFQTSNDNKTVIFQYGFDNDAFSIKRFMTIITDPNGITSVNYKDARGLQTSVTNPYNTNTKFEYNALGELLNSIDPDNNQTSYTYDNFGRLVQREHPDAGNTNYAYDPAGNLISQATQNLIDNNQQIDYVYFYNRLMKIIYPQNPENNVFYEYGDSHSGNQAGKITKVQDASGVQEFSYGNMGEVVQNIHTFVVPNGQTYTYQMNWEYDSWNRLKNITYPDGEIVDYAYDNSGQLISMDGLKGTNTYNYIENITYTKYGSRDEITYGNGTHTQYTYNSLNQHLTNLRAFDGGNNLMQDLTYSYDNAGNIMTIQNSASIVNGDMGGSYLNIYNYDSLYRLNSHMSIYSPYNQSMIFNTLNMSYSPSGNITNKTLNATTLINGVRQAKNYNNNYSYNTSNKPHAVRQAGSSYFNWDANGNMTQKVENNFSRNLCWDEENRLTTVTDIVEGNPTQTSSYLYNAGGERVWKLSGLVQLMEINGNERVNMLDFNQKTLYTSSYMVMTDNEYTKHYYIEGERVCSKLGGGFELAPFISYETQVEVLDETRDYYGIATDLWHMVNRGVECSGIERPYTNIFPELGSAYNMRNESEDYQYFYHSDHLGSSSFITDVSGNATQHLQYLPFGETFVDQRNSSFDSRYKFSAKEKDEETGYSYFGARYYDSELSNWLSVDPRTSKYPAISPFSYCANNPVIVKDPGGDTIVICMISGKLNDADAQIVSSASKLVTNQVNDGVFIVVSHASPFLLQGDINGENFFLTTPEEIFKYLSNNKDWNQALLRMTADKDFKINLILAGCNSGMNPEEFIPSYSGEERTSIAQRTSNYKKNISVTGTYGYAGWNFFGNDKRESGTLGWRGGVTRLRTLNGKTPGWRTFFGGGLVSKRDFGQAGPTIINETKLKSLMSGIENNAI